MSVLLPICPFPNIDTAIAPRGYTMPVLFVINPLAIINTTVLVDHFSATVSIAIVPATNILVTFWPCEYAMSMPLVLYPLAIIDLAICVDQFSAFILFSIFQFTNILSKVACSAHAHHAAIEMHFT
jgi:hypothetical protein